MIQLPDVEKLDQTIVEQYMKLDVDGQEHTFIIAHCTEDDSRYVLVRQDEREPVCFMRYCSSLGVTVFKPDNTIATGKLIWAGDNYTLTIQSGQTYSAVGAEFVPKHRQLLLAELLLATKLYSNELTKLYKD